MRPNASKKQDEEKLVARFLSYASVRPDVAVALSRAHILIDPPPCCLIMLVPIDHKEWARVRPSSKTILVGNAERRAIPGPILFWQRRDVPHGGPAKPGRIC